MSEPPGSMDIQRGFLKCDNRLKTKKIVEVHGLSNTIFEKADTGSS